MSSLQTSVFPELAAVVGPRPGSAVRIRECDFKEISPAMISAVHPSESLASRSGLYRSTAWMVSSDPDVAAFCKGVLSSYFAYLECSGRVTTAPLLCLSHRILLVDQGRVVLQGLRDEMRLP